MGYKIKLIITIIIISLMIQISYGSNRENLKLKPEKTVIKKEIKDILSGVEFRNIDLISLKTRILKWFNSGFISNVLEKFLNNKNLRYNGKIFYIFISIMVIIVIFITGYIIFSIQKRFKREVTDKTQSNGGIDGVFPEFWEKKACEFADKRSFNLAIHCLLKALLMYFDIKNIIILKPSLTNREYLYSIKKLDKKNLQNSFEEFCNIYEYKWYGLNPCSEEEYKNILNLFKNCRKL